MNLANERAPECPKYTKSYGGILRYIIGYIVYENTITYPFMLPK